jgi:hypothetical protein
VTDVRAQSQLDWYAHPAPMTALGPHAGAAGAPDDPADPASLAARIQGWLIHPFHAHRYGIHPDAEAERQLQNRSARDVLSELRAIDPAPFDEPRVPAKRTFGNCRHFATLLTALLRERGVPARSRCGFGAYFPTPGKYEDHWVTELWNEDEGRWQLADAQIDAVQREGMGIRVDTLDLDREEFWVAGQAWLRCRSGEEKPEDFGILDMWGLWFVRDNLLRDLAALCKVELLPWDAWGQMGTEIDDLDANELALLDRVAELTTAEVPDVAAIRRLYEGDDSLRVPRTILSFRPEPAPVEIGDLAQP